MYPKPLIDYFIYFHCYRDYFECHEVLEEYWKEEGNNNILWVGFIQLAVAMYHHRRGNFQGAKKVNTKLKKILEKEKEQLIFLGLDYHKFIQLLQEKQEEILHQKPYSSIVIPIAKETLQEECTKKTKELGVIWNQVNHDIRDEIIDKHKLRDRSDIIEERKKQLKENNKK
ncbi:DUF309 domain-containing protein [Anaerobacillus sp. HL2]|nr:DUF309 domain-containing protein [Anaerobacillus sp. HL2]